MSATKKSDIIQPDLDDDKALLRFTIGRRLQFADQLTNEEGKVPEEEERAKLYLKNLDGLEKIALTRTRIESDERTNAASAEHTAAIIASVLKQVQPNDNPYLSQTPTAREAPKLPDDIEDITLVEGQIKIGNDNPVDIESFMSSFQESDGRPD